MAEVVSIEDYLPARAPRAARAGSAKVVAFSRAELDQILQVYGRKVVAGEWRDYALDFEAHAASFAVAGSASAGPAFRVVKRPREPEASGGRFAVLTGGGRVLRHGSALSEVLKVFEGPPRLL